ncbi:MAG: gamma-glutamyl-gamma-aminobutyrate hydrolase family protein [Proteobacteria bacterium]|nr:gamma-glutamyl-gamma-aminobutyrate hydrolase family protein [Pseudomonadota bacterium]MBU1611955.1 gamma-glutamyl-gamma-aminobutyrate hydrolase family protein [Pseudomonadota bacterium]
MQVTWAMEGDEPRDTLSRSWSVFMRRALPSVSWVPIPNLGVVEALGFLETYELGGIIFTGGGHLGQDSLRDETELALLDAAIKLELPAFGVNRGLLLMQTRFKGGIVPLSGHMKEEHSVHLSKLPFYKHAFRQVTVNSYHTAGIERLAPGLLPFAVDPKGHVEGAYHDKHRLAGVLWSPETTGGHEEFDAGLLSTFFQSEK